MACKDGQFYVMKLINNPEFVSFGINLNAQYVNGVTHFDFG